MLWRETMHKTNQQDNNSKEKQSYILVKLLLVVITLTILQFIGLFIKDLVTINQFIDDKVQTMTELKHQVFLNTLDNYNTTGQVLIDSVLDNQAIIDAFATRNRQTLSDLTTPWFAEMKEKYKIAQFHFHTPELISFFRANNPTNYGDDLSSSRATVKAANEKKEIIYGPETGPSGLGYRVVAPVFDRNGTHIGSVECSGAINSSFINDIVAISTEEVLEGGMNVSVVTKVLDGSFIEAGSNFKDTDSENPQELLTSIIAAGGKLTSTQGTSAKAYFELRDFSNEPIGYVKFVFDISSIIKERNHSLLMTFLVSTCTIIAFIVFIIIFVRIFVTNTITGTVKALKEISEGTGDLTVRLEDKSTDEMGEMARYFNLVMEKIQHSVAEVDKNTDQMSQIGEKLASNMVETASAVYEISSNIAGVKKQAMSQAASVTQTTAAVEEILHTISQLDSIIGVQSENIIQSSSSMELMSSKIAQITALLENNDSVIANLSKATENGRETLGATNSITQQLSQESGYLIEASNIIQHIASQTNMLAMNAAIEAAHAGEAGMGFAVVADEIRKLAEESSSQGRNITSTLKQLSQEINHLTQAAKTAAESFSSISDLSSQVSVNSASITSSMHEQRQEVEATLKTIQDLNIITAKIKNGSTQMLENGKEMSQEMRFLDQLTQQISNSVTEMAVGTVQINKAILDVQEISIENKESIDGLNSEVKKFKIR